MTTTRPTDVVSLLTQHRCSYLRSVSVRIHCATTRDPDETRLLYAEKCHLYGFAVTRGWCDRQKLAHQIAELGRHLGYSRVAVQTDRVIAVERARIVAAAA